MHKHTLQLNRILFKQELAFESCDNYALLQFIVSNLCLPFHHCKTMIFIIHLHLEYKNMNKCISEKLHGNKYALFHFGKKKNSSKRGKKDRFEFAKHNNDKKWGKTHGGVDRTAAPKFWISSSRLPSA